MYESSKAVSALEHSNMISREDRTVGENLEAKITALKMELKRLEDSRDSLKPLLAMKIRDIRGAMDY